MQISHSQEEFMNDDKETLQIGRAWEGEHPEEMERYRKEAERRRASEVEHKEELAEVVMQDGDFDDVPF
jgi:hypothetical protein